MARILIVDDEPDQRFLLQRILKRAGHEVTEAADGAAALSAVRQARPDLVITDMMMPVMGGAELIRRLRGDPDTGSIPILVSSGDCHLAGEVEAMVPKSDSLHRVLEVADALLREGRGPR